MLRLFLFLTFCVAFWLNPVARAGDDAVYMVGLEVHASRSVTPAEAEKISRYLFHNIAKWSPGAAIVVYEGDTRGGGSKVDLNVVVYISKLGKAYSLFVENTDEVALRKELSRTADRHRTRYFFFIPSQVFRSDSRPCFKWLTY
jgi:hypothetical protein